MIHTSVTDPSAPIYRITAFGDSFDFSSLEDAEVTARRCGDEKNPTDPWHSVKLVVNDGRIYDNHNRCVGYVIVPGPKVHNPASLDPGTLYAHMDDAMKAAMCLCHLNPAGCTIYGTTEGPDVFPESGEAYRLALDYERPDGSTWEIPGLPYEPIYTLTRCPDDRR